MNDRECSVTWRLAVPTDVTSATYGVVSTNRSPHSWVSLRRSWDGVNFEQFHLNDDGDTPFDEQVLQRFDDAPAGTQQAYFRGVFYSRGGAATYGMPGMQDLLLHICHKPRNAAFEPVDVTYCWTEHRDEGDVTRSYTERIESLPHRYTINVAGRRDPMMHWVRMNLQGHGPAGESEAPGYSDGIDVGPDWEPNKVVRRWHKNLAEGRPYSASRTSASQSRNPDNGDELTNGVIIAPTDYVRDKTIQAATAFWGPGEPVVFEVDLGSSAPIAGMRVSTHQPNERFCHPASIQVAISEDGQRWEPAGIIRHDDLWNPPGDYEPWEHDDSPLYDSLPACGRLAFSFPLVLPRPIRARYVRFVFTPLEGKGIGISELQVFDRVTATPWPAEIRLPDLPVRN